MIVKGKKASVLRMVSTRDAILKAFKRCAKAIKTGLILRLTRKLQEISESESDEKKALKREVLIGELKALKAVDHQRVGDLLSRKKFPEEFSEDSVDDDNSSSDSVMQMLMSHKKVEMCVNETQSLIEKLRKREAQSRAEGTGAKKKLRTSSGEGKKVHQSASSGLSITKGFGKNTKATLSHSGKIAKRKAVFMDSLDGSEATYSPGQEEERDPREIARIEKKLRNQRNREENRRKREEEMNTYRPADQRTDVNNKDSSNSSRNGRPSNRNDRPPRGDHQRTPNKPRTHSFERPAKSGDAPFQPRAAKVDPERFIPKPPAAAVAAVVKKEMETLAKSGREWKETGVHPSWAAKKIVQPTIVPGQGKKITFGDD